MKYWVAVAVIALLTVAVVATLIFGPEPSQNPKDEFKARKRPGVASAGGAVESFVVPSQDKKNAASSKSAGTLSQEFAALKVDEFDRITKPFGLLENRPAINQLGVAEVSPESLVIGVHVGKYCCAYPLAYFGPEHFVVNDMLDSEQICIVWDAKNNSASAFRRFLEGMELRFSGVDFRWRDTVIMQDDQTESLWSQQFPFALRGQLKGTRLPMLATTVTTWSKWKTANPTTRIMHKPARIEANAVDPFKSLPQEPASEFVCGILHGDDSYYVPWATLLEQRIINLRDKERDVGISIYLNSTTNWPIAVASKVDDKELKFELKNGMVVDQESGSTWNLDSGKATGGSMDSKILERIPCTLIRESVWKSIHPLTSELGK